ncbi:hypothetical protein AOLI_G00080140 [Acnodon oligacanthus]
MASESSRSTSTRSSRRVRSRRRPRSLRTVKTRTQRSSPHGFFEKLPAEVFDFILDHLSAVDASVFSMASKTISGCIMRHVSASAWRNQMILQWFHCTSPEAEGSALDHFRRLGLLCKRCTLLLPTKDRLRFSYSMFSQVPCLAMDRCSAFPFCRGLVYYGVFLNTLIAGWDELECHRVFDFLCENTDLQRTIEAAVTCRPGACHRLELAVRLFCRGVLLNQWQRGRDSFFWLTCILRPWPIVSQARLLFILFGPLQSDGEIGWQRVRDHVVGQGGLWDLAKAIVLLHDRKETKGWRPDTVLSIMDEMMITPLPWHSENMARLLILCGKSICYNILASKAINGRLSEISRLLIFLILVSEKDGYCMKWAVKMTQQVCQVFSVASEKWSFIQNMENMFSEVTMEHYELVMAGNHNGEMDSLQHLCCLLNAKAQRSHKALQSSVTEVAQLL